MNYNEALNWIHGRLRLGMKPGLKRMEWMMEKLDHPERRTKFVHIGGTNGKGSTVSFVRTILQSAGYEVGTFTSPYIEQFNERISVNGVPISDEEMVLLAKKIIPLAEELEKTELGGPTEFEVITAMCLYYFGYVHPVDIVVMEVGLGGRFDSTNVIHPLVSVITNIGMDHVNILGHTIPEIAFEKAGIIKVGTPVVIGEQKEVAIQTIEDVASSRKAKIYQIGREMKVLDHVSNVEGEQFTLVTPFKTYSHLQTTLKGTHQVGNAALAIMTIEYLKAYYAFLVDEEHVYEGVKNTYWPGRFEELMSEPTLIVDGAHNQEGIDSLADTIKKRFPKQKVNILFAGLGDKPLKPMLEKLEDIADSLYITTFDFPRAAGIQDLHSLIESSSATYVEEWKAWLTDLIHTGKNDDVLIITGSLYFISEVKQYFQTIKISK
ncbi:bifunctional tetrahydrofolate synthase/dihydrofolate synthase [Bacillus carboniphilus]|uniref:tetrahydrofolate synthase n=1 Tax=Bacillus carboniphilus TaxID=86663 RepID=A0ABP3G485_9BACI